MTSTTLAATGRWTATGDLPAAAGWYGRHDNAIVLADSKVLVMGGADGSSAALARAAVYDHTTKTWTATGSLQTPRRLHTATRLSDGRVLVAGGISGTAQFPAPGLAAAEIYDPHDGTWKTTGSMHTPRWGHSAVLVGEKVLVAGGTTIRSAQSVKALHSAELFDPATGTWTETTPMTDARSGHPAVVLANSRVLVVGGTLPTARDEDTALAYCELFDPTGNGSWTPTGALLAPRAGHQATALSGGTAVLVTGGRAPGGPGDGTFDPFSRAGAELYVQDTGVWTAVPDMPGGRTLHRAVPLGTTKVLVVGGSDGAGDDVGFASAALFDATTRSWSAAGGLATGRFAFAAAPLSDKRVLVAGGVVRSGQAAASPETQELTKTAEYFDVDAAVTPVTDNAYTFLPWLRSGIATRITTDPGTAARASVPVALRVTAEDGTGAPPPRDVQRTVQIYGPGDVIGIDPRAVSRTEPRSWITNVEPNYLAHIEFQDEDFPWRYSPAAPDATTHRLKPWLALVVLAAGKDSQSTDGAEFTEGKAVGRPMPYIAVSNPGTLPPADQLGAWAHVHVNGALDSPVVSDDMSSVLPALAQVLRTNADHACARLLCPRRLAPNTAYHAFLVPAFETGRLAGLGLDPAAAPGALHPSWGRGYVGQQSAGQLPYYHRWFFSTGSAGDFEYLVRLLDPVPELDPSVGRRDLDVHRSAGPGLPGITTPSVLGGVLKLGGALQQPDRVHDGWDNWDDLQRLGFHYPHPFQQALAGLINLADDYLTQTPATAHGTLPVPLPAAGVGAADPVITPPLYGRWHAPASRLLTERDGTPVAHQRNWVHRLNLDPRFRVAAGLGAQVVQKRQEEFMEAAWAQVGDVLAANARIRAAQLAREVSTVLQNKHLQPPATTRAAAPPSGRALALTAPAHSRVVTTTHDAPAAGGLSAGPAEQVAVGFHVAESRVAAAPLSAPMRRITRPGSRLMRTLPFTAEQPPQALIPRMDADTGAVTAAPPKTRPAAVITPTRLDQVLHPAPAATATATDPVDQLPTSDDFVLTLPGDTFVPSPGGEDSPEAQSFKQALHEVYQSYADAALGGRTDTRRPLGVLGTTAATRAGLRPDGTVPRSLLSSVRLPERLAPFAEQFLEAMAYPVLDMPMYQALLDQGVDLFMPNLNRVPPNSITLLETEQEFIEAYLVGLNHEMACELLWREYPTDQRGTPFRQFWDVRSAPALPSENADDRRERLYDIPPIATWKQESKLGEHDHRDTGAQENELVLVIRGELLKKYPNTAVYVHRARWELTDGQPDPHKERVPVELIDEANPSHDEIRLPLYEAKVEPDIYLLGFDLTSTEAKGAEPPGSAGWFFVIKERPGEPRFGVDIAPAADPPRVEVWNDLSWPDIDPGSSGFIRLDENTTPVVLSEFDQPEEDAEKRDQHIEDLSLPLWHAELSSADIAYILFQAPVLMAVHAQEMLP